MEWSSNERVAEVAIDASIAGRRALICTKSVGMNVMLDPIMSLNLTPVNGGLVILLGDDPGGYGSQNDQDTRLLSVMLEMPMLEPSSPSEAFEMTREAFSLSEREWTAVILWITRSFSQQTEVVKIPDTIPEETNLGYERESLRFVPVPINVVEFLPACNEVLVLEETEPFVKTQVEAIAHEHGCETRIHGSLSGHVSREGELLRWEIQRVLRKLVPDFKPTGGVSPGTRTYRATREEELLRRLSRRRGARSFGRGCRGFRRMSGHRRRSGLFCYRRRSNRRQVCPRLGGCRGRRNEKGMYEATADRPHRRLRILSFDHPGYLQRRS